MNYLLPPVIITSNILGSFNDPFEFEGDYGEAINPIRKYVFEQVVAKEALASNLTDSQVIQLLNKKNPSTEQIQQHRQELIAQAIKQDLQHGPTLNELVPSELIEQLRNKQKELEQDGFSLDELNGLLLFLERFGDRKVFSFFRHNPPDLLSLDKNLRDKAAREGKSLELPILGSTALLRGNNAFELKANLLETLFTKDTFNSVKQELTLQSALEPFALEQYLGQGAKVEDLTIFTTPAGQTFFYWLYHSLNLHLISQQEAMIEQINKVKKVFAETLGNPIARAESFVDKIVSSNASVIFTQESDGVVPKLLSENGLFHSVKSQNSSDGTFVFLRSDVWEPNYQIIAIDEYEGYKRGRLNVILTTKKGSGEKFLLASCHGNSTRSEDGRLQIEKIKEKFNLLAQSPENKGLQLVIGIDANTKSEEEVDLLRSHLQSLGLMATSVGPTTIKKRMVTAQHSKAGRLAVDEEDYIIMLKPEKGGVYQMTSPTVGFREEKPDLNLTLPNIDNPSDHYPIGVTLIEVYQ